jgi:hypothetical protein
MSWVLSSQGVFVLSPPRCGSSCLTACISFQGFSLGKNPTTVKDKYNAKGYFENIQLLRFNSRVLRRHGSSIYATSMLRPRQEDRLRVREEEFKELIASEFSGEGRFIIKDPRVLLLRALYFEVLPDAKIICLFRDREAAAQSMANMPHRRRKYTIDHFRSVWDFYKENCDDLLSAEPAKCLSLSFEDFLESPESHLETICDFLDVPLVTKGRDEALQFIDKKLVRFGSDV